MANDNETVEQVALSDLPLAEQLRIIRGNYCIGSGEFDALDEAADVVECHKREIAAKDAEIARLRALVEGLLAASATECADCRYDCGPNRQNCIIHEAANYIKKVEVENE